MASKRKTVTLSERVDVIKEGEKGQSSRELSAKFGVGRTQIQCILKRKAEVMAEYESAASPSKRRNARPTGNEPINELCLKCFLEATNRKINVSGPMIQEKALQFARELDIPTFTASNGWLESFMKRHQLAFGKLCGESGDVKTDICDDWRGKLPSITEGYEDRDIFNMDESGIFFKTSSDKSFYIKGQKCGGGKKSKERITISLCANLAGEKEKVLFIGKSMRPRAFGHLDMNRLPVTYTNSRKAWMTSGIFSSWLNSFNDKMKAQHRNVLLFLDNAPSHPTLDLSNVKLVFFPPNTTSVLQPMDQGVIQSLKLQYRKAQERQYRRWRKTKGAQARS